MLAVDSPNSFVTLIFITPLLFIHPLSASSPSFTFLGRVSPVNAEVSSIELPSQIIPSSGILSPGFICIISPIFTSSGFTSCSFPSLITHAMSGLIFIKSEIDFLDLSVAMSSKSSPISYKSITSTASGYSPMAKAPTVAIAIKKFSPNTSP